MSTRSRILIVDDNPTNVAILEEMLESNYLLATAASGFETLESAPMFNPDLILLDVMMPGMSGYDVHEQLKADETTRHIPVIYISALNQVFDKVKAFSLGAVDYITKPFQSPEVLARIKTHLTLNRLQKDLQQRNIELRQEITARQQAELKIQETNESLERSISELSVLNLITRTITTVTDFESALEIVVGSITYIFNVYGTSIALLDSAFEEIKVMASFEQHLAGSLPWLRATGNLNGLMSIPVSAGPLRDHLIEGGPLYLSRADVNIAWALASGLFQPDNIQGLLVVPLNARGHVVGLLIMATDQPEREFSPAEIHLAETIAGQIAGAIEVARLFEEEKRQRQLAESLRQVTTVLSASLERPTVLNAILEQLQRVLKYDEASIWLIDKEELVIKEVVGLSASHLGYRMPLKSGGPLTQVLQERQVVILTNLIKAESWPAWFIPAEPNSWMGAPLIIGRSIIGLLIVEQDQVGAYHSEDAQILQTFANQAAIAIENARLYEQAQTVAVDAERQRLARDLHDSVTQSLYSLTLLTSGWAKMAQQGRLKVTQVAEHFDQLQDVSLQALKEMRLLLHQLRPPVLEEVGLLGALQQRLEAVEQRVNVETRLLTRGNVDGVPSDLAAQLYFIAQEALNNVLRHAQATNITVGIEIDHDNYLILSVADNGIGFDPATPSFGLGLETIRERTEAVGGQINIASTPQQGTTVSVTVALGR